MWKHVATVAVGGLENIGFIPSQDYLIVLSSNGDGIFDCSTGERIARVHNNYDWNSRFNDETMVIKGFALFADIDIQTSGLHGSDKLRKEYDGWSLIQEGDDIFLTGNNERQIIWDNDFCELRAFGFSETGRSFVIASSCELIIYNAVEPAVENRQVSTILAIATLSR